MTVAGTTDPLVDVSLERGFLPDVPVATTRTDAAGHFTFSGIPVASGYNAFIVTATSTAGNTSSAAASYSSLAPDTSPPQITLQLAHDTGGDGLTRDPTVSGVVVTSDQVTDMRVSVNGSPLVEAAGALVNGRFSLSRSALESILGGPLADGPVSVAVVATNSNGVASAPVELDFTLDTTRPPTPDVLQIDAAPISPGQFITNASVLTIHTGLSVATAEVVLYANGVEIARQTGAEPLQFQVAPPQGQVEYLAQAVDAAGNVSFFTAPLDVTIDRTMAPPTVTLDPLSVNATFGAGAHTTLSQVILDGTAKPGATISLLGTPLVTTANAFGRFTLSGVPVVPGDNLLRLRSTDSAGNTAEVTLTVTMHDVTAPSVSLSLVNDTGIDAQDRWTNDPTLRGVVDDASTITTLEASINNGPFTSVLGHLTSDVVVLDATLLAQLNGGSLDDGQFTLQLRAGDAAANVSQPTTIQVLLTRVPPPATIAPSLKSTSDTGASAFDRITNLASPEIRLFAQRNSLVTFYEGDTELGQAYSTGVATIMPTALADGVHSITATISDQAGNTSERTPALVLTVYTTPPTVPSFSLDAAQLDPVRADYTTADEVTLHGHTTTETGEPPATLQVVVGPADSPTYTATVSADASGDFTFDNVPLTVGDNLVTVVAIDVAGNTSQFSLTLTRGELLPPLIVAQATGGPLVYTATVSGTVMAETSVTSFRAGFDGAAADQYVDVLADLAGGGFTFSPERLVQINGAPLSAGPHVLHLVATDSRGLSSPAADVSFTLDTSPQASVDTSVTFDGASGLYTYTFTLHGPAGADWAIDQLSIPVPLTDAISNLVTPSGMVGTIGGWRRRRCLEGEQFERRGGTGRATDLRLQESRPARGRRRRPRGDQHARRAGDPGNRAPARSDRAGRPGRARRLFAPGRRRARRQRRRRRAGQRSGERTGRDRQRRHECLGGRGPRQCRRQLHLHAGHSLRWPVRGRNGDRSLCLLGQ